MRVCVIGAGVIGCATAYQLMLAGHDVVLLDANDGPGRGTSFANGAQLSYSYVEPFASPSTLRSLPKLFLSHSSPVRFRLRLDPNQWSWGMQFLAACTSSQARKGTTKLLELAAASRATLESWLEHEDLNFGYLQNGKLVICPDQATLDRQAAQIRLQSFAGVRQEVLGRAECIAREPRLSEYRGFVGGIWTESECVGDAYAFCHALVDALRSKGGHVQFGAKVTGFDCRQGLARRALTSKGEVAADAFVICTGVQSVRFANAIGDRLPIYPIKGYSITLTPFDSARLPFASVTDLSKKMVFAPLGDQLRIAAMAEVVGWDMSIPPERLQTMTKAVEEVFPGLCDTTQLNPWAGLRPATPTSVPIIRPSATGNIVWNVGHGALGFTLAAGSAVLAACCVERIAD